MAFNSIYFAKGRFKFAHLLQFGLANLSASGVDNASNALEIPQGRSYGLK